MPGVDHSIQTTLVTGASSGIGLEFAHQLAARGLTVTSLINCAGFGTWGRFDQEDPVRLRQELAVDVTSLVDLTRAFIGPLQAAGTGVLINVASTAAYGPVAGMAVYGAAKAFVLSFTEALRYESRGTGLRVLALCPGATRTESFVVVGTADAASGTAMQTPRQVVETALRTLDRPSSPPSVVSGRANPLMASAGRLITRRGRDADGPADRSGGGGVTLAAREGEGR